MIWEIPRETRRLLTSDFLYGDANGNDMSKIFEDLEIYADIEKWTDKEWIALLDK